MGKKIVHAMSILNIVLAVILYFSINSLFIRDPRVATLLEETGFVSTLIRLTLYIIPGIFLITGLFGLVFSFKRILTFIGSLQAIASILVFLFLMSEGTPFFYYLGIVSMCISGIYLFGALIIRKPKRKDDKPEPVKVDAEVVEEEKPEEPIEEESTDLVESDNKLQK